MLQTSRHRLWFFLHIYLNSHGCFETKPLPIYEHIRYDEETSQTTTGVGLLGQQAHSLSSGNTNCHNSITNTMNKHRLYYRPASQILVVICIMKSTPAYLFLILRSVFSIYVRFRLFVYSRAYGKPEYHVFIFKNTYKLFF